MRLPAYLVPVLTAACGVAVGAVGSTFLNKPALPSHPDMPTNVNGPPLDKRQLVEALLEKLDTPRRYNESIAVRAMQAGGPQADPKTAGWMRELWIQQLGWERAKESFIRYYSEAFTEAELRELLGLLDRPLPTKLLVTETQVLEVTSRERAERFAKFWDRYNNLEFQPPP